MTSARMPSDSPPKRDRDPVRCPETQRRRQADLNNCFHLVNYNTTPLYHEIHLSTPSRKLQLLLLRHTRRHGLLRHLVSATQSSKGLDSAVRVKVANEKAAASSIWRWPCLWYLEELRSSLRESQCMHLNRCSRIRAVQADLPATRQHIIVGVYTIIFGLCMSNTFSCDQ